MIRLAVSVEGRTEEEFVKKILADHLYGHGVAPVPILIGRARGNSDGGNVSVERLAREMAWLYQSFDAVTSLVDFYGFRRREGRTIDDLETRLNRKICEITRDRNQRRVFPYIQQYEFEGLLFSNVEAFTTLSDVSNESVRLLRSIRSRFSTPEDINDHPDTAPSKRIQGVIPKYRKVVDGPLVAGEVGLDTIRRECRRFNEWMESLERLEGTLRNSG